MVKNQGANAEPSVASVRTAAAAFSVGDVAGYLSHVERVRS